MKTIIAFITNILKATFNIKGIIPKLFLFIISLELSLNLAHFTIQQYRKYINTRIPIEDQEFRILAIGESTTDKLQHAPGKNAWPQQLEDKLNNDPSFKNRFTIINEGRMSVNTLYHAQKISEYIRKYKPHLIISMLGINETSPLYVNEFNKQWYAHFLLVKLFKWFQWQRRTHKQTLELNQIYPHKKRILRDMKLFLSQKKNHSKIKIFNYIENLKNKLHNIIDPSIIDDIFAEMFVEIGFYNSESKVFYFYRNQQIKSPNFYHRIALELFSRLLEKKIVAIFSPHTLPWLVQKYPKHKIIRKYTHFLAKHRNEIIFPASQIAILKMISLMKIPITNQNIAHSKSVINSFQKNYMHIINESLKNGITIVPMQYPRLPTSWLRNVIEGNKIVANEKLWFCSDYLSVEKSSKRTNEDIIIISNENIRDRCLPDDSRCFLDRFHYCQNNYNYTFGHAGPILDEMIAENAYNTIKKNWEHLQNQLFSYRSILPFSRARSISSPKGRDKI